MRRKRHALNERNAFGTNISRPMHKRQEFSMERNVAFALIATRHFVPEMQASRETIIKHRRRRRYCTAEDRKEFY